MYFVVKVKVITEDDRGKQKSNVESYLVDGISVSDAEVKVNKKFEEYTHLEFEVTGASKSKIIEVIE